MTKRQFRSQQWTGVREKISSRSKDSQHYIYPLFSQNDDARSFLIQGILLYTPSYSIEFMAELK
jgi:hypothetical protein